MKRELFRYFSLAVFALLLACSAKQEQAETETADADDSEWPLMDEFHMVMAESFHPFKDSANIDPAIANAPEMAALAEKWSTSELPSKVDNDNVKADLEELKTESAAFAELVQDGDVEAIRTSLINLHNIFHRLQDAWYKGEGGHHHGDHKH
ncbi:MAG: hypothetical protein KF845_11425 [Cyclobacteriaceae bacterium]|nr:hypothetical protein [Cyclobacteriaceae bacterium]